MSKIYLKPEKDMTIPHPDIDGPITPEGAWVPNDKFYRGFVSRGEAQQGKPPEKTPSPEKAPTKKKTSHNVAGHNVTNVTGVT